MPLEIAAFRWVFHALAFLILAAFAIFLLWFANAKLGLNLNRIADLFLKEIRQLMKKEPSVGRINMLGIVVLFIVGLILLVADAVGTLENIILLTFGQPAAESVEGQWTGALWLLALFLFGIASLVIMSRTGE